MKPDLLLDKYRILQASILAEPQANLMPFQSYAVGQLRCGCDM